MKTIDAITAYQAVLKLIDDPKPKCVLFSFALAKNRRVLEPIVQHYTTATANLSPDERKIHQDVEVTPDIYPLALSLFPERTDFGILDMIFPLIAGDE
jgi:hypothetical protein